MSLLEKAQAHKTTARQDITPEHIELAHAFIRSEVGITAVNGALGYPPKSIQGYITVCRALRQDFTNMSAPGQTIPKFGATVLKDRFKDL